MESFEEKEMEEEKEDSGRGEESRDFSVSFGPSKLTTKLERFMAWGWETVDRNNGVDRYGVLRWPT